MLHIIKKIITLVVVSILNIFIFGVLGGIAIPSYISIYTESTYILYGIMGLINLFASYFWYFLDTKYKGGFVGLFEQKNIFIFLLFWIVETIFIIYLLSIVSIA